MQLLHTHWRLPDAADKNGEFLVWVEDIAPEESDRTLSAQKKLHPRALDERQLAAALPHTWVGRLPYFQKLTLWLPSDPSGPLPPPEFGRAHQQEGAPPVELKKWGVRAIPLNADGTLTFLAALNRDGLPPSRRLGADAQYWQTVFSFALELIARQLYRPALVRRVGSSGPALEARWLPVLDGEEEARRAAALAAAMPPICRAGATRLDQAPSPGVVLDSFLNALVDAAVRKWARDLLPALPRGSDPANVWLFALFGLHAGLSLPPGQVQQFAASFAAWERALTVAGDRLARVALRLEAPEQRAEEGATTDVPWRLHYLLQARDDASLIISADDVWNAGPNALQALGRHFEQPQERLLTGLGYAARFFEPIRRSLEQRAPTGVDLTAAEAYDFLRHCAPQLQRAGFGLLVPPWWNQAGVRLGVRLKLQGTSDMTGGGQSSRGLMNLQHLVSYQWRLALGDTELSRQEFDALVALKSPLVQIRGQWVQLDPEQVEAAIRFWRDRKLEGALSPQEALQLGLGREQAHDGLPLDGVEMDETMRRWLDRLQGDERLAVLPPPEGLRATLRPYQQYGYSWLHFATRWGLGVILADDMGLGKTVQALTMIQRLKEDMGKLPGPVLLICPTSVVTNWKMEVDKFAPDLRALVHHGLARARDDDLVQAARASDLLLTSYALVRRDGPTLNGIEWAGVILDEAQNIKNATTKQAQVIRKLRGGFRVALTGTPVENRLSELWSIMHFLNPGFLGGPAQFRQQFVLPIEKYGDEAAAQRLRKLTRPFLLRRVKTDPTVIQDLPDKQEVKVYCQLSEEQATLYEAIVRDALEAIEGQEEGIARKGLVLSMLMQLKQVCNHPAQYLHESRTYRPDEDNGRSGKLQRFEALLDEVLAEGDRMLIFSQFTEMADLLRRYIEERFGVPTLYLHGGVPATKRAAMVEQFQQPGGPPIFLLSLKAGGTGLNLTQANHVFHFDRWWNPAVEDQATDRAFRIGQTKNVLVHKFVCLGTLEERIDRMIEEKKALAASIIGSGENWLTELSTADLRELVSLRRDDS